jgi:hypothetical protein
MYAQDDDNVLLQQQGPMALVSQQLRCLIPLL